MSNKSSRIGKRFEYRVRDWFRRAGFEANRVPVSGASPAIKGDVVVKVTDKVVLFVECKRRTDGYRELFRWLDEAMNKGVDVLVLGVGREKPIVIARIDKFIELFLKRG